MTTTKLSLYTNGTEPTTIVKGSSSLNTTEEYLERWPSALQSALYHSLDVMRSSSPTNEVPGSLGGSSTSEGGGNMNASGPESSPPLSAEDGENILLSDNQIPHDARQYKTRMCLYASSPEGCPHGSRCFFAHGIEELRPMIQSVSPPIQQQQYTMIAPTNSTTSQKINKTEYKTKMCRYSFAECPFAAIGRCQFAHSLDELRPTQNGRRQNANAPSNNTKTVLRHDVPTSSMYTLPSSRPSENFGDLPPPPNNIPQSSAIPQLGAVQQQAKLSIPSATTQQSSTNQPSNHSTNSTSSNGERTNTSAHHARRFKTRLCKYHMAGHCPYAATNTCQFAHSEDELRSGVERPSQRRPSALDAWGSIHNTDAGIVGNTRFPHTTSINTGSVGTTNILGGERAYPQSSNATSSQQQQHLNGANSNNNGAALRAALEHKRFTKLCKYFLAGHCPFTASNTCQFAHSTAELRRRVPTDSSMMTSPSRRHSADIMPSQPHPSVGSGSRVGQQQQQSVSGSFLVGTGGQSPVPTSNTNSAVRSKTNSKKHIITGANGSILHRASSVPTHHLDPAVGSQQQEQQPPPPIVTQDSSPRLDPWQTDAFITGGQPDWSFRAEDISSLPRS